MGDSAVQPTNVAKGSPNMNELVCVSDTMTSEEAHIAKLALEEDEIPCFLADSNCAELFSYAMGGVKLMVPAGDVPRATQFLSRLRVGKFVAEQPSRSRSHWPGWLFLAINVAVIPVAYILWRMVFG